ncbi:unnamed protein product [Heterobilharzia americana]|nr:unnamed protein product [Heterobilharzia americana]
MIYQVHSYSLRVFKNTTTRSSASKLFWCIPKMFSFEGHHKTSRPVTYDRTRKLSAHEIVRKTREERRIRENQQKQNHRAIKIQAFVRGCIVRNKTKTQFLQLFDKSAEHLLNIFHNDVPITGHEWEVELLQLLRLFNLCCCKSANKDRLLTIWRFLVIIVKYLSELPLSTISSNFTLPVCVLESVFLTSMDSAKLKLHVHEVCRNIIWFCRYLSRQNYFKRLAYFISQHPICSTDDVPDSTMNSNDFAAIEYLKRPRIICISVISENHGPLSNSASDSYKEIVVTALNDILLLYIESYSITERIIRSVGEELFRLPGLYQIIVNECLSAMENKNKTVVDENNRKILSLIPSVSLLHILLTVFVPGMLSSSESRTRTSDMCVISDVGVSLNTDSNSYSMRSASPTEAAVIIRCLSWLLTNLLADPCLPIIRPFLNPKPLHFPAGKGEIFSDDDDGNHDEDEGSDHKEEKLSDSSQCHRFDCNSTPMFFRPVWPSQVEEICMALHQHLPVLASSALTTLENPDIDLNDNTSESELIRSLAQLHYYLSEVHNLPRISLIRINSVYSQHAVYLRLLWKLIENTQVSTAPHSDSACHLLTQLTSGELPSRLTELQSYLPLIFTFADCLHHRLMCLTDVNICNVQSSDTQSTTHHTLHDHNQLTNGRMYSSGSGFRTDELLHIGAVFSDLVRGLVDLAHPDHIPKKIWYDLQTDSSCSINSVEQLDCGSILYRIKQRKAVTALGASSKANVLIQNRTGWSIAELRILLYCWSSLFHKVQRLVFQIFDWSRRCRRQQIVHCMCANSTNTPGSSIPLLTYSETPDNLVHSSHLLSPTDKPSTSETFWLKDNLVDLMNPASLQSWLEKERDRSLITGLADAPFGYYSILNPDRVRYGLRTFTSSNRELRLLLLFKELPFIIPFEKRVKLFRILVNDSQISINRATNLLDESEVSIVVRRTHLYEDAFEKLSKRSEPNLLPRLKVQFLNQVGLAELGIDCGGLSREFLTEIIRTGFDPNRGFFIYASDKTVYPNPQAAAITPNYLDHYFFLGRILAKAIYDGMLVELHFAYFFLAKIVSRSGGGLCFDYLYSLDPQLYKHLLFLKNYQGNVRDLSLDFTMTQSIFGLSEVVELKPDGKLIAVTEENRIEYIHLVADYKLNKMIYPHVKAFIMGLNDIIPINWLRLFDAEELQTLISGADSVIDVNDLKQHTLYVGNSLAYTETVDSFWHVLQNFSEADKRSFLRFVTACSRPPMFGFRELQPPFSLQITDDIERLPTASTCMNLLRLPDFRNAEIIRDRLLYALNANAGFEYS